MKYLITVFLVTILTHVTAQESKSNWKLADNNYIKSYGKECSILVFSNFGVARNVLLIEPSLESQLNKVNFKSCGEIDRIIILFTKSSDSDGFDKSSVYHLRGTINEDDKAVLIKNIQKELSTLKVKVLMSEKGRIFFHFAAVFLRDRG